MAMTEWMLRGPEIATCNCAYGCPCQFNALPTYGDCRAAVGMHIEKGHHGKVNLDGLNWAGAFAWPGAIHMGHGEVQPIIDERATPEQREALLTILSGQDSEPGATYFQVFASTIEKMHPPVFKKIDFKSDMKSCDGHISVDGMLEVSTTAIRNPMSGNAHHPKVALRAGFEFAEAEFASGSSKSPGPVKLENENCHAHLAMIHITGKGVVR
ncbi:MAG: DUF1326 domain-containing protein [Rhizobiales bacterium]|nr:DUF1326 domain-containing protein [Hyphomicrobiales bacterium]